MSRAGDHVVHKHPEVSAESTIARRQLRARRATAAGLAAAAAVTIGLLASAQAGGAGGSSAGVATLDPSQGTAGVSSGAVSSAGLGTPAIEPAPPSTLRSGSR